MLKIKQLAERLGLSLSKCYELVASGEIAHHRIGGSIRVSEEQLAFYLERTKREREPIPRRRGTRPRTPLKHITL
jgi:excisionase family DNA binding protein